MPISPSRESDRASGPAPAAGELRRGEQVIGPLPAHNPIFCKRAKAFDEVRIDHAAVSLRVHVFTIGDRSWLVIRSDRGDVRVRLEDVGQDFLALRDKQRIREAAKRGRAADLTPAGYGRPALHGTEATRVIP